VPTNEVEDVVVYIKQIVVNQVLVVEEGVLSNREEV